MRLLHQRSSAILILATSLVALAGCRDTNSELNKRAADFEIDPSCVESRISERNLNGASAVLRVNQLRRYAGRRIQCNPLRFTVLLKGHEQVASHTIKTYYGDAEAHYLPGMIYSVEDLYTMINSEEFRRLFPGYSTLQVDTIRGRIIVKPPGMEEANLFRGQASRARRIYGVPILVITSPLARSRLPQNSE